MPHTAESIAASVVIYGCSPFHVLEQIPSGVATIRVPLPGALLSSILPPSLGLLSPLHLILACCTERLVGGEVSAAM